jgi:urease accessory protein
MRAGVSATARTALPTFLTVRRTPRISTKDTALQLAGRINVLAQDATVEDAVVTGNASREWLIWQLADSAFPTGGFAHSSGLEAAWQHGEIRGTEELVSFASTTLRQLKKAAIPFVAATHGDPATLMEVDQLFDAFTPNHVANRASRKLGQAFLLAVRRIFAGVHDRSELVNAAGSSAYCSHLAPLFGAALRLLDVPLETTVRLFVFGQLRSVLAAAVRLNIVGPMEAQTVQHRLGELAGEIISTSLRLGLDDVAQTAPLLDLWQGSQDRLYSRLFQS